LTGNIEDGKTVAEATTLIIAPAVSLSPTSLVFADQLVGSSSTAQTVTLTNTGNAAVTISNIAITGANASDYAQSNNCGGSVAAGASCTINLTFSPTADGPLTGTRTWVSGNSRANRSATEMAMGIRPSRRGSSA
jgi:archaellum component FlaF (FlaF/FlaG flagellin family)